MSMVLTNAYVRLSTTTSSSAAIVGTTGDTGMIDISPAVMKVTMKRTFDQHDDTHMGLTAHSRIPGLESWEMTCELLQDYHSAAAPPVDELLDSIISGRLKVLAAVRPINAARTTDNPEYWGPVRLFSHSPIDGSVGDLLKTPAALLSAGNLTRAVCATS